MIRKFTSFGVLSSLTVASALALSGPALAGDSFGAFVKDYHRYAEEIAAIPMVDVNKMNGLQKKFSQLMTSANAAAKEATDDAEMLKKMDAQKQKLEADIKEQSRLVDEARKTYEPLSLWQKLRGNKTEFDKAYGKLQEMQRSQGQFLQVYNKLKQGAETQASRAIANLDSANALKSGDMKKVEEKISQWSQNTPVDQLDMKKVVSLLSAEQLSMAANNAARDVFDANKQNAFDAKILLTNLDSLKAQYQLSDQAIETLKQRINPQLENTFMSQYMDQKIKQKVCEARDSCSLKSASPMENARNEAPLEKTIVPVLADHSADQPMDGQTSGDANVRTLGRSPEQR